MLYVQRNSGAASPCSLPAPPCINKAAFSAPSPISPQQFQNHGQQHQWVYRAAMERNSMYVISAIWALRCSCPRQFDADYLSTHCSCAFHSHCSICVTKFHQFPNGEIEMVEITVKFNWNCLRNNIIHPIWTWMWVMDRHVRSVPTSCAISTTDNSCQWLRLGFLPLTKIQSSGIQSSMFQLFQFLHSGQWDLSDLPIIWPMGFEYWSICSNFAEAFSHMCSGLPWEIAAVVHWVLWLS